MYPVLFLFNFTNFRACKIIDVANVRYQCFNTDRVFSSSIYGPSAKRAGHKSKGKKRGSVTYSTDRENEVSKIIIVSLVCV